MTIKGGTISGNKATYGGGIMSSGTIKMSSGNIISNSATTDGGGAIRNNGTMTLSGGTISNNTARFGAGISLNSSGTLTMTGGTISSNTASETGGGIHNQGTTTVTAGSITSNKATSGAGGGVLNYSTGTLTYGGTANVKSNTSSSIPTYNTANYYKFRDNKGGYSTDYSSMGTYYRLPIKKNNAYVLDVYGNVTRTNGQNVILFTWSNSVGDDALWKILPDTVESGTVYYHFEIKSGDSSGNYYAMDNTSNSSTSGNNVQIYQYATGNGERWSFSSAGSGYYDIKSYTGLCLDLENGTVKDNGNIQVHTCNQTDSERWKIVKN